MRISMLLLAAGLTAFFSAGEALAKSSSSSHSVRGHVTKRGAYVAPHRQQNPDSSRLNNWSSKGNLNPYTGKAGTQDPYKPNRRR